MHSTQIQSFPNNDALTPSQRSVQLFSPLRPCGFADYPTCFPWAFYHAWLQVAVIVAVPEPFLAFPVALWGTRPVGRTRSWAQCHSPSGPAGGFIRSCDRQRLTLISAHPLNLRGRCSTAAAIIQCEIGLLFLDKNVCFAKDSGRQHRNWRNPSG